MSLKRKVKSLEEVEEQYRDLYAQQGDEFVLQVEGGEDNSKLKEFRQNNLKLSKQVDELTQKLNVFANIDPAKIEDAMKALTLKNQLEEQGLLKEGKLDEVISMRTQQMRTDFDAQLAAQKKTIDTLTTQANGFRTKLADTLIRSKALEALNRVGVVKPTAVEDAISRAEKAWKVNDETGELEPNNIFDDKGEPATLEYWAKQQLQVADHLFVPGSGGGAGGSKTPGVAGGAKVIAADDPLAFGANLEAIASGKAIVQGSQS